MILRHLLALLLLFAATGYPGSTFAAEPRFDALFSPFLNPYDPDETIDHMIEGQDAIYVLEALVEKLQGEGPAPETVRQNHIKNVLLHEVFPKLVRVRIKGSRKDLQILALFDGPFRALFEESKQAKQLKVYGIEVPKFLRLRLKYEEPLLALEAVPDPRNALALLVKIPLISDRVYLHRIDFDAVGGSLRAEAGVLGDHVSVFAKAEVYEKRFDGIDYWKTFLRNYRPFLLPLTHLQWQLSRPN
jgi:hypothetical protein